MTKEKMKVKNSDGQRRRKGTDDPLLEEQGVAKGFLKCMRISEKSYMTPDFINEVGWVRQYFAAFKGEKLEKMLRKGLNNRRTWHEYIRDWVKEWNSNEGLRRRTMGEFGLDASDCQPMDEEEAFRILTSSPEAKKVQALMETFKALGEDEQLNIDEMTRLADEVIKLSSKA